MKSQLVSKALCAAALGLVFLAGCGVLHAQVHAPSGPPPAAPNVTPQQALPDGAARVISQSGQVSVVRSSGDLWAVMPNDVVQAGQEIISGPDGHALLELSDTSRVEVFPNSRLVFRAKVVDFKDLMNLILGKVRVHIEKIGGQPNPYRMSSPTALIAVRGTTFDVIVAENEDTFVSVEEGAVDVSHRRTNSATVRLMPGQSITVYANEPLAQSQVNKLRVGTKIAMEVAARTMDVMRQIAGTRVAGIPTTGSGQTPASNTPGTPGTTGGPTQSGNGTGNPPTNGRGNGSGNNGDTGSGNTVGPTTPGTGSGSNGGGGGSNGPASRPRP